MVVHTGQLSATELLAGSMHVVSHRGAAQVAFGVGASQTYVQLCGAQTAWQTALQTGSSQAQRHSGVTAATQAPKTNVKKKRRIAPGGIMNGIIIQNEKMSRDRCDVLRHTHELEMR